MFERVLKVGLAYELVAPASPLPTITSIVWRCRHSTATVYAVSVLGVLSAVGALSYHLLLEGWDKQ